MDKCQDKCVIATDGDKTNDDDSYPNPDELMKMSEDTPFDWRRASRVLKGPICWKCFLWSTFFDCRNCGRSFHRKCALVMGEGSPQPVFDKSVDEAMSAEYGRVNILKCPVCIISEETRITSLRNHSQKELNEILYLIAQYIHTTYADILEQVPANGIDTYDMATVKIRDKTLREEYKTIEGFHSDFRMIWFNIVKKHGRESEGNEVAQTVMQTVERYLRNMIACNDCTKRSFATDGKILSARDYSGVIREPCAVPHLLIWVKEGVFPYWPAKILNKDLSKSTVLIQYFGEKPGVKEFSLHSENTSFRTYSLNIPGGRKSDRQKNAISDCKAYVTNMRAKFQDDGAVVIPVESELFDGDLNAGIRRMFPFL